MKVNGQYVRYSYNIKKMPRNGGSRARFAHAHLLEVGKLSVNRSSVFVWVEESKPDTPHRIRVTYAVSAYPDSCVRRLSDDKCLFYAMLTCK